MNTQASNSATAGACPAAPASAAVERLRELLAARAILVAEATVTRAALNADDAKWRLSTTVTRAMTDATPDERISAAVAVLTAADPAATAAALMPPPRDPEPMIPGPGTDAPGHPAWCRDHDAEVGDGTSVCSGEDTEIVEDLDDPHSPSLSAHLVQATGEAPRMFIDARNDGSVSLDAAREYAELILELVEQAEAGSAVTA